MCPPNHLPVHIHCIKDFEQIGRQCADTGTCHHGCTKVCARRNGCVPLSIAESFLNDDWTLRATPPAQPAPTTPQPAGDAAIAQAFRESVNVWFSRQADHVDWVNSRAVEIETARAIQAGKGDIVIAVRELVFCARTTGGTAGRDPGLCAALDKVEAIITSQPYIDASGPMADSIIYWQDRALKAEADITRMWEAHNEEHGPTLMGEPVLPQTVKAALPGSQGEVVDATSQNYQAGFKAGMKFESEQRLLTPDHAAPDGDGIRALKQILRLIEEGGSGWESTVETVVRKALGQ